ncbi:MAG: metal ABC transporter permease [Pseudomonadota bacterium]
MIEAFLVRAALGGAGVALAAAPLGCFVVWRRMAYFGDATAHAALLGVALSLAMSMPILPGVLVAALAMAVGVTTLANRGYAQDTVLGVLSHGALAAGLVAISLQGGIRVDLSSYLLGDILAIDWTDVVLIWAGAALVITGISWRWSALLTVTLQPDMATASGLRPEREQMILTLGLAIVVAVAIKVVGALLISALLLMPPAAARSFTRTPEAMATLAALFGVTSAIGGLAISLFLDTPTGPTIVCTAAAFFATSVALRPWLATAD